MLCPNCKAQIQYGVSVCPVCNAKLNTAGVLNDSNGTAVAAFVMALLSIGFPILTIPAIVCGHIGLGHSRKVSGQTGQGLAVAALVIGYLTVTIWLFILLCVVGGCTALVVLGNNGQ